MAASIALPCVPGRVSTDTRVTKHDWILAAAVIAAVVPAAKPSVLNLTADRSISTPITCLCTRSTNRSDCPIVQVT